MRVYVLLFLAAVFSGCATPPASGDPKEILTRFFTALSKQDIQEAKKYVTADSEGMLNMMQMSIKNTEAPVQNDNLDPEKVNIGEPVIDGDMAKVPVTEKETGETVTFNLHKEKGHWKVAFDMGTLLKMAREKMSADGHKIDADGFLDSMSEDDARNFQNLMDSLVHNFDSTLPKRVLEVADSLKNDPKVMKQLEKLTEELRKRDRN